MGTTQGYSSRVGVARIEATLQLVPCPEQSAYLETPGRIQKVGRPMTLEFRCKEGGRRPLWNSLEIGKPWPFFCWSHTGSVSDLPVSIAALPLWGERASALASKGSCICHGN